MRAAQRERFRQHTVSDETRKKLAKHGKRRRHSEESKAKMAEAAKQRTPANLGPHPPEWNKKIADAQRGRMLSEEHKAKLREAWKLRREKLRASKTCSSAREA
jgi:hypothetical protein